MTIEQQQKKRPTLKYSVSTLTFLAGKKKKEDKHWLGTALREFHEESGGILSQLPEYKSLTAELSSLPLELQKANKKNKKKNTNHIENVIKDDIPIKPLYKFIGGAQKKSIFIDSTKMGLIFHQIVSIIELVIYFCTLLPHGIDSLSFFPSFSPLVTEKY